MHLSYLCIPLAMFGLAITGGDPFASKNVIHLLAIAGRVGVDLTLDDWDRLGRDVPTIVNLMPSGKYLMEDFFYAGGVRGSGLGLAIVQEIARQHGAALRLTSPCLGTGGTCIRLQWA